MLARIHSAATIGLDARILDVEVDASHGLPRFTIVGLPDTTVREARERVRSALRNASLPFPGGAVTVNLAPADFRKSGAALDLAVAVGLLWTCGLRPADSRRRVFVGELGLGGELRATRGALCLALAAREAGFSEIVLPASCAAEASAVDGIRVIGVRHVREAVEHLLGVRAREPETTREAPPAGTSASDLSEIRGQAIGRRAAEIAAAGGHHLLLAGPPGSGKTMLARRLPGILPALTREEAIEVTRIHSVAGTLPPGGGLVATPPFRAPHHGISAPALVGGGARPVPGEISLAHRGALFLDELAEFRRDALESIRQPLEERRVRVVRVGGACDFPCDVLLVAAMNPCPCGFLGDPRRPCTCASSERLRYSRRISGPLLDRVDLRVAMPPVPWRDLSDAPPGESSCGDPREGRGGEARGRRAPAGTPRVPQRGPDGGRAVAGSGPRRARKETSRGRHIAAEPVRSGDPPRAARRAHHRGSGANRRNLRPTPVRGPRAARRRPSLRLPVRSG